MSKAYLNGEFLPLENTQISVLDRGFLFGDGVYEVIPFYNKIGLGEKEHLQRLQNSLKAVGITSPLNNDEWHDIFEKLLAEQIKPNHYIYLQVTRGATLQRAFTFPDESVKPTIFAFSQSFEPGRLDNGINAITQEDQRWKNCYIKSINLLPSCLASEIARQQNANEAILISDHYVTEGASSNVFIVKDETVFTTPISDHILNGITRQFILNILQQQKISYQEANISMETLRSADEIWITSSTREIAPVLKLDHETVGSGKPGAIWQKVHRAYHKLIEHNTNANKKENLLKFPCDFPIKIMGKADKALQNEVLKILAEHAPEFNENNLEIKESGKGNYYALTATIHAKNKAQLDAIYQALTDHELVIMTL